MEYIQSSIYDICFVLVIEVNILQVDDLKAKLAIQEIELKQKNEAADALIEIVRVETEKVSKEKAIGKF